MSERVMGIDPGLTRMGIGLVQGGGSSFTCLHEETISTNPADAPGRRLAVLYEELARLMKRFSPSAVALERVFLNRNSKTAVAAMQAAGVAMLTAEQVGAAVFEYSPAEMKVAICGSGSATKEQVRYMVKQLLANRAHLETPDATDGLALAICHINSSRFANAVPAQAGAERR
jgi:crossover junction endodeoxyribonuclease RuvC